MSYFWFNCYNPEVNPSNELWNSNALFYTWMGSWVYHQYTAFGNDHVMHDHVVDKLLRPLQNDVQFNPLNPKIKIWILICWPYLFPIEVVGRSW